MLSQIQLMMKRKTHVFMKTSVSMIEFARR